MYFYVPASSIGSPVAFYLIRTNLLSNMIATICDYTNFQAMLHDLHGIRHEIRAGDDFTP